MDREQAMAAGGAPLISGWLDSMLTDSLAFADDETDEERDYKIAAAREAVAQLAPEGAGLGERMQAAQYVCAFQAGQLAQAQANSRYLPPDARAIARRFARQAMALSSRQLALLNRLGRERQRGEIPHSPAFAEAPVPSPPDRETGTAAAERAAAAGSPVTAVQAEQVPVAPPGPDSPLNRHERRTLANRRCKARKRLAGAA